MRSTPDHYEVLGVTRDASTEDIERARKLLARHWHPDRNKREDAAQRFDEVQKAAEMLRDPVQRAAYDRELAVPDPLSLPREHRTRGAPAAPEPPGGPAGPRFPPPEPAHERAGPRAKPGRPRARKAMLGAALAAVVVTGGIIAVVSAGQGHPAPAASASRGTGANSPAGADPAGGGPGSTKTFALPPSTAGQQVFPVTAGRLLSIGRQITLLAAGGQVIWHETAEVGSLNGDIASGGGPRAARGCVVAGDRAGSDYEFISLTSGRQAVVATSPSGAGDSLALAGGQVALPDGTLRNPCTGAVTGRAAPRGTFTAVWCLAGPVVVGTGRDGLMAWADGHELWRQRTSDQPLCDTRGSVLLLDTATHKISYMAPRTGRPHWTVADPGCPGDCLKASGSQPDLLGVGQAVLLSGADQTAALSAGDGTLLWRKREQCALAVRGTPGPEVLLGSCTGQAGGDVTVAAASTGAVVGAYPVAGDGCAPGGAWAASSRQLLVVCPGPPPAGASPAGAAPEARLITW